MLRPLVRRGRESLGKFETTYLRLFGHRNDYPPTFVLGAPRSGTTAVYLHVVNRFQMSYVPNIADTFPCAPLLAARCARLLGTRYSPTFDNRYGVVSGGPLAPGDGWNVFHRWFPRYDHGVGVDPAGGRELPLLIGGFEALDGLPFINKNNNHCTRVGTLARWLPESRFVHVVRDLPETAASLVEARRAHGLEPGDPWSVHPPALEAVRFEDEIQQAVYTILQCRSDVRREFERIEESRWTELQYREVCRHPSDLDGWLGGQYDDAGILLTRREKVAGDGLRASDRRVSGRLGERVARWAEAWESGGVD